MRAQRVRRQRPLVTRVMKGAAAGRGFGGGRIQRWHLVLAVVGIAVAGAAGVGAVGWTGSERWMGGVGAVGSPAGMSTVALSFERITFPSRDSTPLAGWYLPAAGGAQPAEGGSAGSGARGTVVVMHGLRSNSGAMVEHAEYLQRGGFNVLLFDFRASGASGGEAVTYGAREQLDALGALDYLASRGDVDMERVGFQGVSMGAVVALMVAVGDPRVAGVVAEAPFSSFSAVVDMAYAHRPRIVRQIQTAATTWMLDRRLSIDTDRISAVRAAAGIGERPILIIEDEFDEQIPPGSAAAIAAAAGESGSLWIVHGASHGAGHQSLPDEFERRVLRFWESAFGHDGG